MVNNLDVGPAVGPDGELPYPDDSGGDPYIDQPYYNDEKDDDKHKLPEGPSTRSLFDLAAATLGSNKLLDDMVDEISSIENETDFDDRQQVADLLKLMLEKIVSLLERLPIRGMIVHSNNVRYFNNVNRHNEPRVYAQVTIGDNEHTLALVYTPPKRRLRIVLEQAQIHVIGGSKPGNALHLKLDQNRRHTKFDLNSREWVEQALTVLATWILEDTRHEPFSDD